MKRVGLGVLVVGMIVLVFSTEGILALMRTRNINVLVEVRDSNTGQVATQQATAEAGKGQQSADVVIAPEQHIAIKATWDYRIGPRFPQTLIHADAQDSKGKVVAADDYTVNCGSEPLQCSGSDELVLDYGVIDGKGTHANWPEGDYTLHVSRTYTGFNPQDLLSARAIHVRATQ
jgi:hypothetical protein